MYNNHSFDDNNVSVDLRAPFFYATHDGLNKASNDLSKMPNRPVKLSDMVDLAASSIISKDTLIWTAGMKKWCTVEQIPNLLAALFGATASISSNTETKQFKRSSDSTDDNGTKNTGNNDRKHKRRKQDSRITAVYVNGIPDDATKEELINHFSKLGCLQVEPLSGEPCVTLYTDENNVRKGDGVVVFMDHPTMLNAVLLLDDAPLRPGSSSPSILKVEQASWQPVFAMDRPISKEKLAAQSDELKRALKVRNLKQKHAFSWDEEGVGTEIGLKIIV